MAASISSACPTLENGASNSAIYAVSIAVAVKAGTVPALLSCLKAAAGHPTALIPALTALRKMMVSPDLRAALLRADGCEALLALLQAEGQDTEVLVLVGRTAAVGSKMEEDNKIQ